MGGMHITKFPAAVFNIWQSFTYFQVIIKQPSLQSLSIQVVASSHLPGNHKCVLKEDCEVFEGMEKYKAPPISVSLFIDSFFS